MAFGSGCVYVEYTRGKPGVCWAYLWSATHCISDEKREQVWMNKEYRCSLPCSTCKNTSVSCTWPCSPYSRHSRMTKPLPRFPQTRGHVHVPPLEMRIQLQLRGKASATQATLHNLPAMRLLLLASGLLASFLPLVSATALTYKLTPNEKACFFAYVEEKGAKLAFYFAVR